MGDRALRTCLLGAVLVNLLQVHLTEAARPAWLLALAALTVLSPLLSPLRERLLYRGAWNLAVVGVFALLLHHATGQNLRYVLEDGLVLAALCQVHLLNNLREDQRPDLLFLNSFLIAVVTGYLAQGLTFALALALQAPLLVVALCLYDLARHGTRAVATRRVVVDALGRATVLGLATLVVFAAWPRDFQRRGLLADHVDLSSGSGDEVGFDDELSLDQGRRARASGEVVLRVTLESGSTADVPALWRGATLMGTSGERWWPLADGNLGRGQGADRPWRAEGRELVRGAGRSAAQVLVETAAGGSQRLFAPLAAERLGFEGGAPGSLVARPDATLVFGEPGEQREPVRYRLGLASEPPALGGATPRLPADLRPFVELPSTERVRAAVELASELASEVRDGEQQALVEHLARYLSTSHEWLPPGAEGAAGSLAEFLAGGAGHCEFFASALAIMLRSRGVPCRVVTGYRSREWDGDGRVLTVRRLHAHAWVEVLDPRGGWYAVDPNPAPALDRGPSAFERLHGELLLAWQQLTSFDAERRAELMSALRAAPGRAAASIRTRPLAWGAGLAGIALLALALRALLRLRRRRGLGAARLGYERAVRRAGLRRGEGETPRELLERAVALGEELPAAALEGLRAATREHERARYAGVDG